MDETWLRFSLAALAVWLDDQDVLLSDLRAASATT
jgi:hypothetical protein